MPDLSSLPAMHPSRTAWGAVFSIALAVAGLITAEFLPISLLTPLAEGLGVSQGMAGQTVAIVSLTAIISSLFVTTFTRGRDRRAVVLLFSSVLAVSNAVVAFAPDIAVVMCGRLLLGLAVGGFWSMSASLAIRLARPADVPKALSVVFGGASVAMVIAAPAGSLLEPLFGWRGVFLIAAAIGVLCLLWQFLALPPLPAPRQSSSVRNVFQVLQRPGVRTAMLAMSGVFAGQFTVFTFIRPLLELRGGFDPAGISAVLLVFGLANFVGTSVSSVLLKASLKMMLVACPLLAGIATLGLNAGAADHVLSVCVAGVWGFAIGCMPVGWSTWVTRNLGDDAENAGSLQVALIQVANMIGAAAGGMAFEAKGVQGPVALGASLLLATVLLIAFRVRAEAAART